NLLAAFVGRGLDLCNETGYLGAITSRVGMFLTTFQAWRREVLLGHGLVALADLGNGVMQQAMVEAAAFVLSARRPTSEDEQATFIRLLKDRDRSTALRQATFDMRRGAANERIYRMPTQAFQAIPGAPVAYWMADEIRRLFSTLPCIEGTGADVRQGVATAD